MKKPLFNYLILISLFLGTFRLFGQAQDILRPGSVYTLEEMTIRASSFKDSVNAISAQQMDMFNRTDAARALNVLPGVTLSNIGARNESVVFIRGFDLRQVPVFIDGVPVYVPYDGYVDLGRFTTFDLAEINVSKGFSSMLYGPNTLGGAINLVSRKPTEKFELSGATGYMTGGYRANLNVGSRIGKFYVQGGLSRLSRDYYNLSGDFDPVKNENGGRRDNSYSYDTKLNIRIGYTPSARQEYVLSYVNQQGEKGTPLYAGSDTRNSLLERPRYWQWPYWNKESFYFLSNTTLDTSSYIRLRLYYDRFKNLLESYDDDTYSTITRPYAFQSYYNDDTYGGSFEYGTRRIKKNHLKLAGHYKHDRHRENNAGMPVQTFEDNTFSLAVEDIWQPFARLRIIPGISYNLRSSGKAQDYNSETETMTDFPANTNDAWNLQVAAFYHFTENRGLSVTAARKSRFATVKDRYSYRMGTAIPNPDLNAESSLNYELSYSDLLIQKVRIQGSLFYNQINDVIQNVDEVQPGRSQLQNAGQAAFYGAEASVDYRLHRKSTLGANYTYLERKNISNPDLRFTNVPNHKVFGYIQYNPTSFSYIVLSSEYNSRRYSTSYGAYAGGFMVANAKVSFRIWKYFGLEGGVNNILDRNYSIAEGYPEQGRNYFINIIYKTF